MLLKFDDTSHDATRRTIVYYAMLAVVLFYYKPSIDLKKLFDPWMNLQKQEIGPIAYGIALCFIFIYLAARHFSLLPLHNRLRKSQFEGRFIRAENRVKALEEITTSIQRGLDDIDNHMRRLSREDLERMQSEFSALSTGLMGISEFSDKLKENKGILEGISRKHGDFYDKLESTSEKFRMPVEEAGMFKKLIADTAAAQKPVKDLEAKYGALELPPEIRSWCKSYKEKEFGIQGLDDWTAISKSIRSLETKVANLPKEYGDAEDKAISFDKGEIAFFGRFVPAAAFCIGITASLALIFGFSANFWSLGLAVLLGLTCWCVDRAVWNYAPNGIPDKSAK